MSVGDRSVERAPHEGRRHAPALERRIHRERPEEQRVDLAGPDWRQAVGTDEKGRYASHEAEVGQRHGALAQPVGRAGEAAWAKGARHKAVDRDRIGRRFPRDDNGQAERGGGVNHEECLEARSPRSSIGGHHQIRLGCVPVAISSSRARVDRVVPSGKAVTGKNPVSTISQSGRRGPITRKPRTT